MKNTARHIALPAESAETIHTMQCMEVWGGNVAAETGISVHGIDAWLYSQPFHGEINGGDIHYVSMCGQGRIARFVLADVAGHGSAVNDLAIQLRTLMRKHVSTPDQTRFARSLNRTFGHLSREGLFATAALATYFAPTDEFKLCLAGHPRPLWYHAESDRWSLLPHEHDSSAPLATNLPLGIIRTTEYNQFAVTLKKGDLIVLYSDGLIETGGAGQGHIGEAGLLSLAAQIDSSNPSTVGRSLIAAADAKSSWPSGMRNDDLTVLVLHHNAANPPPMSIWHKARMMVKMLGVG